MDTTLSDTQNVRPFDPKRVRPLPDQPRKRFTGIMKLGKSIQLIGQTTPGIVTLVTDDPNYDAQLIDGERRLRACVAINHPFEAVVKENAGSYFKQFLKSVAANFQRQDHNVIEIAHALKKAHDGENGEVGLTIKELAALCGKSTTWVTQHLSLLKLSDEVQQLLIGEEEDDDADADTEVVEKTAEVSAEEVVQRNRSSKG